MLPVSRSIPEWAIWAAAAPVAVLLTPVALLALAVWALPPVGIAAAAGLAIFTWRIKHGTSPRIARIWSLLVWLALVPPVIVVVMLVATGPPGSALPVGPEMVLSAVVYIVVSSALLAALSAASFLIGRRFWKLPSVPAPR